MTNINIPEELKVIPYQTIVVPEFVEVCAICKGEGHYIQYYNAGCGGHFEALGSCEYCSEVGFRYKLSGDPVGASMIAQIVALNQ